MATDNAPEQIVDVAGSGKDPFIALEPIYVGNARAHAPGDVVPDANVKAHGWERLVGRASSQKVADLRARLAADPGGPSVP